MTGKVIPMNGRARRVVAYCRVSTDKQADDGQGLDYQQRVCEVTCEQRGFQLVAVETDSCSGTTELQNRPGLIATIAKLGRGQADGVIVFKLDRLSRDLVQQEFLLREVWKSGWSLHSCAPGEDDQLHDTGSDPSRDMIRQIMGAVAQYERKMILVRTKAGKREKIVAGGFGGGTVPYGKRLEGDRLLDDAAELETVAWICELRQAGRGFPTICRLLNGQRKEAGKWVDHPELAKPTRGGGPWLDPVVRKIVRRVAPNLIAPRRRAARAGGSG